MEENFTNYMRKHTPLGVAQRIIRFCEKNRYYYFSSPFDESAVDFLEELQAPAYKIASPEIIDINLIKKAASTGKPIIISTGMASQEEIKDAIDAVKSEKNDQIIILHLLLHTQPQLKNQSFKNQRDTKKFNVITGLSDHSLGTEIAKYSVLLGACFIEKHFIFDKKNSGWIVNFLLILKS